MIETKFINYQCLQMKLVCGSEMRCASDIKIIGPGWGQGGVKTGGWGLACGVWGVGLGVRGEKFEFRV